MGFPPVPKELSFNWQDTPEDQLKALSQNISSIFLYLQRMKDQSSDEISTVIGSDPSLGGTTFADSNTLDFTASPGVVTAEVLNDTSIQKIEVAVDGVLISTRKRLNLAGGITVVDNAAQNRADIAVDSVRLSRVVTGTLTLPDTTCIISSRYFEVQGILVLEGDATLEVI